MSVCFQNSSGKPQSGFTLLEVLVSIVIMGLVIGYFVNSRIDQMKVQLGENIAQEVMSLTNLATSHYVASELNPTWPGQGATPACSNAIAQLQSLDYLPAGYTPNPAASITTSCPSGGTESFNITIEFPLIDEDLARIVKTALPSAVELPVAPGATTRQVEQRVFPPRRVARQYSFFRRELDSSGTASVPIPECGTKTSRFIAIPQVMCVHHPQGLQGYYFVPVENTTTTPRTWDITLCVGTMSSGGVTPCGTSSSIEFNPHQHDCDGEDASIGVVTYCE